MASLLDDWTVNEDATQGTRLTYSTEALKKIGAQCQITSTTSAPLDFPLVAQADVLVHVDPDYHLCARARLSPSDHHSNGPTGSGRLNAVNGKTAVRNGKLPSNSSQKNHVPNRVDRPQLSQSTNVDKPMLAKQAPAPYQSTQFVPTPAEIEKDFAKWRRDVPRDDEPTYRSLGRGLARFYQDAFRFVQAHPGMMQDVISMLGREGGLRRINELISSLESSSTYKREIVREQVLPFFRAISFERVVASAVLEAPLGKIHQFLYGPNGRRAEALFTDILDVLKNLELQPLVSVEDSMIAEIYETSVMVLLKMVQANGDALINESIHRLVDRMSGILVPTELRAKKYLARISRILDMDKEMPKAGGANSNAQLMYRPNFHVVEDLPGNLSEHGPRHDNDSSSIRDIKIMPTSQEIQSTREEYLPTRDPSTWHVPGLRGLLDRQFRLLREDTVGQLRDAVCDELNRMQSPESVRKVRGRQGLRTHTYQNVQFRDVVCHHREGLRFTIDFDQPEAIRGNPKKSVRTEWWTASRRLDLDALVCLLDSNGSAIFCYVISKRKGNLKKGVPFSVKAAIEEKIEDQAQDSMRASVLLGLVQNDAASVRTLLARFQGSSLFKQESLVEFPGVLLPSFQSTLLALQDMAKTLDLPFSELIAPEDAAEFNKDSSRPIVSPPAYALATGFKFDLKSVLKNESKDLFLSLHDSFDFESLVENTTLDHAQAHALVEALTRSIALVQGPPGTGKSYTGVSLIKVLLDNRVKAKIGPIICVCYTNHALDQLLEQLLHSGVTAIVRLGAQSKSELLRQFNLAEIARNTRTTKNEGKRHRETDARLSADAKEVNDSLGALRQAKQWTTLKEFLNNKYPEHHDEFFSAEEENWQTVRYRPEQIISNWLKGNDQPDLSSTYSHPPSSDQPVKSRSLDELRYVQLRGMTVAERHGLWNAWSAEMIDELQGEVLNSLALYEDDKAEFEKVRKDLNLRCLQNAHIVGVTTTGLAKNLDLLRRLPSKVIICEEAGEVLEAHCLTTLLPSIEHAVLIGDHMQLRPRIQNWELNSENPRGEQYSLDVSLFERLVASPIPSVQLPHSTLEIQRRMDPSISQLIRKTIYPHLKDSHAVCNYPPVAGMARRLFWYHHEQHEAAPEPDKLLVSQYNEYEIEFVAALVSHLVKQGVYGTGDIAVLTPYLGQLMRLRRRLSASHEITMGERDQEELLQAGLDDDEAGEKASKPKSTRSTLLKALRVSTVDNFQGEEAKVVVISLVRSNKEKNCGFLKTFNRINVLLSRAKHGMYIIGNAKTAYGVQMWADVINILRKENNFGGSLELSCPRHPETPIYVTHPDDFHEQAPEGGCARRCDKLLQCGHSCKQSCHSKRLHSSVRCMESCPRSRTKCDHPCPNVCGESCPEKCLAIVRNVQLECGHNQNVPCWQRTAHGKIQCQQIIAKVVPSCGHVVEVPCHVNTANPSYKCVARCGTGRSCGHRCKKSCHLCRQRDGDEIVNEDHGDCIQQCGSEYYECNHTCIAPCHQGPCPPCMMPCETSCRHRRCGKRCGEACPPCTERCDTGCPHGHHCTLPCGAPCNCEPCDKRCAKKLACGHTCPSVCGEKCPPTSFCQICATEDLKKFAVDLAALTKYNDIDLNVTPILVPECGHIQTVESMDGQLTSYLKTMDGIFSCEDPPTCSFCRGNLGSIARYARVVRRSTLDLSTKKLVMWTNRTYVPLAQQLDVCEEQLAKSFDDFVPAALPPHMRAAEMRIAGSRTHFLEAIRRDFKNYMPRYEQIFGLRNSINLFLHRIYEDEASFVKLFELVRAKRMQQSPMVLVDGIPLDSMDLVSNICQVQGDLLGVVLLLRCDLAILTDYLAHQSQQKVRSRVHVDLSADRKECRELWKKIDVREFPRHYTELRILGARFAAIERVFASDVEVDKALFTEASNCLEFASVALEGFPKQTRDLIQDAKMVTAMQSSKMVLYRRDMEPRKAMLAKMAIEADGEGKWYACEKGHPLTLHDEENELEKTKCPTCDGDIVIPENASKTTNGHASA